MTIQPPPRIAHALSYRKHAIEEAISTAVDLSFKAAEVGTQSSPEEPDFIAYFYLDGLQRLETSLNQLMEGHQVKVTLSGIFCHQTPKVLPERSGQPKSRSCELGDLLLATLYTPKTKDYPSSHKPSPIPSEQGGPLSRAIDTFLGRDSKMELVSEAPLPQTPIHGSAIGSAVLLQSKMYAPTPDSGDPQWQLYAVSDSFHYKSPKSLAPQKRYLQDASAALWYWSLLRGNENYRYDSDMRWSTKAFHARSASRRTDQKVEVSFSNLLWNLFAGVYGEPFFRSDSLVNGDLGWSKIVNDLIGVTAEQALNRKNANIVRTHPNALRGSEALRAINGRSYTEPSFLVRASLGDALAHFGGELENLGRKLEIKSADSLQTAFVAPESELGKGGGDGEPPRLGRIGNEDDDSKGDGMSFIIANWQEL